MGVQPGPLPRPPATSAQLFGRFHGLSTRGRCQDAEQFTGDVALEAPADLCGGPALCPTSFTVLASVRATDHPAVRDGMDSAIGQLASVVGQFDVRLADSAGQSVCLRTPNVFLVITVGVMGG
jgi:hypothetical protein